MANGVETVKENDTISNSPQDRNSNIEERSIKNQILETESKLLYNIFRRTN